MKKIIYSARDASGKERHGFVEASSNPEARQILQAKGLLDIQLNDDALIALRREDLEGLSEKELEAIARFEQSVRAKGPSMYRFLLEVLRKNSYLVMAGVAVFLWGVVQQGYGWIIFGLLLALSMPALSLWNYRSVLQFDRLLRSSAKGNWDDALQAIQRLRPFMSQPELAFDLDLREACILARRQPLADLLKSLERWAATIGGNSPGLYEARLASVFYAAVDTQGFLQKMREAHAKSSESPTLAVDLALAEARFGELGTAEKLLSSMNETEMPPYALPYIAWIRGLLARRSNSPDALAHFASACEGMLPLGDNPAVWTSLAVCTGTYAAALLEAGKKEQAAQVVQNVWPVLQHHGDRDLLAALAELRPASGV